MVARIVGLLCVMLLGVARTPCLAQGEPRVLYSTSAGVFTSAPIASALRDLGIDPVFAANSRETRDALVGGSWDLVIVRRIGRYEALYEGQILGLLRDHVDAGGALHFQMADLENVPDGWYDLLGLEGAVDLRLPLSDIRAPRPVHPSVPGVGLLGLDDERFPPDYGDALLPSSDAFLTQWYESDQRASTIISADGRVLVNGQQWDNWAGGRGFAERQISWLIGCRADLDGDGSLTIFDFLEFQTLFDARDVRADVFYDRRFDIFDFLEYFNQFQAGC